MARSCDGCRLATSITNHTVKIYSRDNLDFQTELACTKPIVALECSVTHPQLVFAACEDGAVMRWDLRAPPQPQLRCVVAQHGAETYSMAIGFGDALCAVGGASAITFYDLRAAAAPPRAAAGAAAAKPLGAYEDAHTDLVTCLAFRPGAPSQLASASEDGLVCVFEAAAAAGAEPVVAVLNAECPVRRVGFFGPGAAGVWAATGSEGLSLWHAPSAQRVAEFGGAALRRPRGAADYLVGCRYDAAADTLALVAGTFGGEVQVSAVTPAGVAAPAAVGAAGARGHAAVVRAFDWAGQSLITGGEDARLCCWSFDSSGGAAAAAAPAPQAQVLRHKGSRAERRAADAPYSRR
ncbi:WD40-repeat-containing domain protein [Tribonema minus]|uniref:WD40-repeat-containing domain protein n=1 Tax=Tribonema minus TaxID=303371 RepID=A0A835YUF3_9STRA|nr:WD40-repeat-containing domain protein [Tribonema minus]